MVVGLREQLQKTSAQLKEQQAKEVEGQWQPIPQYVAREQSASSEEL